MSANKPAIPCVVCNPADAEPGELCDKHREELHRLDHQYETLFRLQRTSRGKDHETYELFLQGECDPCGRIVVTETDPENLFVTVLLSSEINLDELLGGYSQLGIEKKYGDLLRERIQREIIHSWYGNARACVDVFRITAEQPRHWDIAPRGEQAEEQEDGSEPHPPQGGKHSVH
jgi:hypothetical protein